MPFLRQLRYELLKMFSPQTHVHRLRRVPESGNPILYMLNRPRPKDKFRHLIEQNGYGFEQYFSGTTLAMMIVTWTTVLLGSLYLALVTGDLIAKEVEGLARCDALPPGPRLRGRGAQIYLPG